MTDYTIGVDISKEHLEVCRLPGEDVMQFANDKAGLHALIKWISAAPVKRPVKRIVYEPTGAYHRLFEDVLSAAGLPLAKVNPLQARRFAQACGQRAKTDAVDRRSLARMGMALELGCTAAPSKIQRDLKALAGARQALIKDRTAAKNRAKQITLALLQTQNAERLRQIEDDLKAIEASMLELVNTDAQLKQRLQIISSIPGIGQITALSLIVEIPELGTLHAKQAASLAGLAPHPRESGQWKGRRFIGAGRKLLREALYMPALVACRFNQDMKDKYSQLIQAGKPPKLAITAIMRKLIILANTLIKNNRMWTPNMA